MITASPPRTGSERKKRPRTDMKQLTAGADRAKSASKFRVTPVNPGLQDAFREQGCVQHARQLAGLGAEEPNAGSCAARRTKKTQIKPEYVTAIRELPTFEG
jgi:hypothetical protein